MMKTKLLTLLLILCAVQFLPAQSSPSGFSEKMPATYKEMYARIDSLIISKANKYRNKPMKKLFKDLEKYKIDFKSYDLLINLGDYKNFNTLVLNLYSLDDMYDEAKNGYETFSLKIKLTQKYPRQCNNIYLDRFTDFSTESISWSSFKTALSQKIIENISLEIIPPMFHPVDM